MFIVGIISLSIIQNTPAGSVGLSANHRRSVGVSPIRLAWP
jgi:hypothetical protein